ncbi:hypothetical protein GCM10027456_40310 [Kineosporia babensis]
MWWATGMIAIWQALAGARMRRSLQHAEKARDTDMLTGLPNRRHLEHVLSASRVRQRPVMVGLLDLNRFKQVNDTYGHACGDLLLVAVAVRLQQAMHGCGVVARLGGDEFAVVWHSLPGLPATERISAATAESEAQRVITMMADRAVTLDGTRVPVGGSLGVVITASWGPGQGAQALHEADQAMYVAKQQSQQGGDSVHVRSMNDLSGTERRLGWRAGDVPDSTQDETARNVFERMFLLARLGIQR